MEKTAAPVPRGLRRYLVALPILILLFLVLVGVDSLSGAVLWIAAGNMSYLEENVVGFVFQESVFDLAVLAVARGLILAASLIFLEQWVLRQLPSVMSSGSSRPKLVTIALALVLITTVVSFGYGIAKGAFVIKYWAEANRRMHIAYKVLCIVSVVLPLVEAVLGGVCWWMLRRIERVLHLQSLLINDTATPAEQQTEMKKRFGKAELRRLLAMAQPEYSIMAVGILCLIISSLTWSVAPYFFGRVIDQAKPMKTNCTELHSNGTGNGTYPCPVDLWPFSQTTLILLAVFTVGSIATLLRSWLFTLAGERFVARLRRKLFASVMKQEIGFFDQTRTGELISRLTSDTQAVQNAVTVNISMLARYTLQMILCVGMMFWQSPQLTAVLLSVVPIIVIGAVQYGKYLKNLRKRFQDALARASSTAEESIANVRTVRSFSNDHKMVESYETDINESYRIGRNLAAITGSFVGVVGLIVQSAAVLVLWYGGYLVYTHQLTSGALTALMLYTLNLAMAFAFLSSLYGDFMQAVGASLRIFDLLDRIPQIKDGSQQLDNLKGEICFKNVVFRYPSRPEAEVLKGISLQVLPGQVVALVGPSGGGKSTIVNLIEKFYDFDSGQILLGGHNVQDLDPTWFRKHMSVVSQEPVLFARSIAENIKFGREDATPEEVAEAALQANAHEFISSFESGYDTLVGERGVRLSGGQKQRVAIARALLIDPTILLLDEATSALDAESEHLVQEAIDRAMKGRTVLVIAHRLSTVRNADLVIVINEGRVEECGTHDELISKDGVYKKLVLRQLTAGENSTASTSL